MKPWPDSALSPLKKVVLNPEDEPETPSKPASIAPEPSPSASRLKFKYTVIEKPKNSPLSAVLVLAWLCLVAMLVYSSYMNRLTVIDHETR